MDEKKTVALWRELSAVLTSVLILVNAHLRYQNLSRISHLYTPEELLQERDGYVLLCVLAIGVMVRGLWNLLTCKCPRELMSGIFNWLSFLCWSLTLLVCKPAYWGGEMKAFWGVVLILLLGSGCWDLWKYRKQKLYEETL